MTHKADIGIRLERAGPFAAMQLAATRGDLEGYKQALKRSYGPLAKSVFEKTIDQAYEYALKETERLNEDNAELAPNTLVFWKAIIENHDKRSP